MAKGVVEVGLDSLFVPYHAISISYNVFPLVSGARTKPIIKLMIKNPIIIDPDSLMPIFNIKVGTANEIEPTPIRMIQMMSP